MVPRTPFKRCGGCKMMPGIGANPLPGRGCSVLTGIAALGGGLRRLRCGARLWVWRSAACKSKRTGPPERAITTEYRVRGIWSAEHTATVATALSRFRSQVDSNLSGSNVDRAKRVPDFRISIDSLKGIPSSPDGYARTIKRTYRLGRLAQRNFSGRRTSLSSQAGGKKRPKARGAPLPPAFEIPTTDLWNPLTAS